MACTVNPQVGDAAHTPDQVAEHGRGTPRALFVCPGGDAVFRLRVTSGGVPPGKLSTWA